MGECASREYISCRVLPSDSRAIKAAIYSAVVYFALNRISKIDDLISLHRRKEILKDHEVLNLASGTRTVVMVPEALIHVIAALPGD